MDLVHWLREPPDTTRPTSATIGFFDAVHRGHQAVIGRTVDVAGRRDLIPVAVTFDRHPRETYAPGTEPPLLTTLERKSDLITSLGVEGLLVLEFTQELAAWPPEEFVDRVVVDTLHASHAAVGSNFTFGHQAMGTLATLTELGAARGFDVEGVSLVKMGGRVVSSSEVRTAIASGDLEWPTEALGRRFVLDGRVTTGAGRGAGMGWPTANLEVPARMLLPGEGVYAGRAILEGAGAYAAAINVGTNPTFGAEPLHVEAYLLDFEGDLRGEAVAVEFWARLRDEQRFDSPEDLSAQIAEDVERTRAMIQSAAQTIR